MNIWRWNLTAAQMAIIGLALILVGQLVSFTLLKIDMGFLISNVGALLLVVGMPHWFLDEESRQGLIDPVAERVTGRVSELESWEFPRGCEVCA